MAKDAVLLKWCGAEPWKQGHDTLAPAVQVDDSVAFAREMRKRHAPSIPCISAGQSMGGLVATHLVLRDQDFWAGLILCSAAIDAEWNLVLR